MFWSGVDVPQGDTKQSFLQSLGVTFSKSPSSVRVIVVGGGLSGQIVADALQSFGFDVSVLEGRGHRSGGRIDTRTNLVPGLWAEAGPEFLSPAHNILRWHINHLGLSLLETSGMEDAPFTPIVEGGDFDYQAIAKEMLLVKEMLIREAEKYHFTKELEGSEIEALDDDTLWSFIESLDISTTAKKFLETHFEFENGIDPREIGLLPYLLLVKSHGPGFFENLEQFRLAGGMSNLTSKLESRLANRIRRGAKVSRITFDGKLARCILEKTTGSVEAESFQGEEIILTTPPRLWNDGELFGIQLQKKHIPQMGDAIKVLISVPAEFAIPTGILPSAFLERNSLVQAIWEGGIGTVINKRILTVMCGGSSAEKMLRMHKSEIIAQIIREISVFCPQFNQLGLAERDFFFKDWGRKKLTGCGYGCPKPYELTDYRPELMSMIPSNLILCGEWESPEMWGYMEGAVRSALSAVLRICHKYGATIPDFLTVRMVI